MKNIETFFYYARERYRIMLRRGQGMPPDEWTADPILRQCRFCNVFREDDKVTRWIKSNVRDPLEFGPEIIPAIAACRLFNRVETLQILKKVFLRYGWNEQQARRRLDKYASPPYIGAAYMVKSPTGLSKLEGLYRIIEPFNLFKNELYAQMQGVTKLQAAHRIWMDFPFIGCFLAYEIVTDLRHTTLLRNATDIDSWANAGPGAAKGLGWVAYGDPKRFRYTSAKDQDLLCKGMKELLKASKSRVNWPSHWPSWEMRDVEHTLCEVWKYARCMYYGQRLKQKYRHEV